MRKDKVDDMELQIDQIKFWDEDYDTKGGMRIYWSGNIGCGELTIVKHLGRGLNIVGFTESMDSQEDKGFTKKILSLLAEKLMIVD